jgi:hypothetical protein
MITLRSNIAEPEASRLAGTLNTIVPLFTDAGGMETEPSITITFDILVPKFTPVNVNMLPVVILLDGLYELILGPLPMPLLFFYRRVYYSRLESKA